MSSAPAPHTFIAESRELLRDMESALLAMERSGGDGGAIDAVFRTVHTIKGSSGMFGLDEIVEFTHALESVMVEVREGRVEVDGTLVALLLACGDHVLAMVDTLEAPDRAARMAGLRAGAAELLAQLSCFAREDAGTGSDTYRHEQPLASPAPSLGDWHISVRFAPDVLRHGMDPLSLLRYLATLGEITDVVTAWDAMPDADAMDPQACYLALEIRFRGAVQRGELETAFEYVREGSTLRIVREERPEAEPLGVASAAPERGAEPPAQQQRSARFLRVDAAKLDDLIDLVGELVIASAGVGLRTHGAGSIELREATAHLGRLVEEVRDGALALRMVPIGETFQRFHRVVHDLGPALGKEVELVVRGAETELDKSMVEKLNDPLMHLVRNAMDHGIEPPDVRRQRGKMPHGRLMLNAYHETGSIVIEVADDGGGLDRDRIRARAVQVGLLAEDQQPEDHELHQLLMEPGFSTAAEVTSVSGRGIGMDVVRRNVEALHGSIAIHSTPGEGTVMALRVPLTLAIIDGFLVRVGRSSYVVPLEMVVECLELGPEERARVRQRGYLNLRGDVLPLLRLRELFDVDGEPAKRENIVVVQYAGQRAGFLVDALLGEFQTVIKPLGKLFERLAGIGGSTILGSGEVALILDVQALVERAASAEAGRTSAHAAR